MHFLDLIIGLLMGAARWLIILVLSLMYPELYSPWSGEVVDVVRPHEIRVQRHDGTAEVVRLYGIHCPLEPKPFAKEARTYVANRVLHRKVVVQSLPGKVEGPWYRPHIEARDAYGRIMGLVTIEGESLNKELLRKGIAWWYKPLVPFERGFKRLEDLAREDAIGLWQQPNPAPAWNFQATPVGDTNPLQADTLAKTPPRSTPLPETKPEERPLEEGAPKKEVLSEGPASHVPELPPREKETLPTPQESAGPPTDETSVDDCRNADYIVRLTPAYRAVANLTAIYWYACSQVRLNWEERDTLVGFYNPNPQKETETEDLLRKADNPCPESVHVHEDVRKLWALCLKLKSLANEVTSDRPHYEQRLESLRDEYDTLMKGLKQQFPADR